MTERGFYIEKYLGLIPSPPNCSKDCWKLFFFLSSINYSSLVTSKKLDVVQKIYSQIHPVSHTNIYHGNIDLVNHGMVTNKEKIEWPENGT